MVSKNESGFLLQRLRQNIRMVTSTWVFHLFVTMIIIILVFSHPPQVFSGDDDTARNYLNTIVSSLSTILALCISIILVAIQLTASNYTHRVLDFYVRLPYNVSLFSIYLITIVHSFYLMTQIKARGGDQLPPRLQPEMSADLVLVVICFLSLLAYMYAIIQLLKPERIIELIIRDYQGAVKNGRWQAALDNLEQICDIAKRAASVSDSVTGTRCLEAMSAIAAKLPLPRDEDDPILSVHKGFLDQWIEIVGVAVKEKETGLLLAVFSAVFAQGRIYVDNTSWASAQLIVQGYQHMVFSHLLPEGQQYYAEAVARRLYQLAARAARMNERGGLFAERTWQIIAEIGENVCRLGDGSLSVLSGFLMVTEALDILYSLEYSARSRRRAVSIYFFMWKAFAQGARRGDIAKWAVWWQREASKSKVYGEGQALAWLLVEHLNRKDLSLTLRHVWGGTPSDGEASNLALYEGIHLTLFDGSPWAELWPSIKHSGKGNFPRDGSESAQSAFDPD